MAQMYVKTMPTQLFLSLLCQPMYRPVCILIMAHSHQQLLDKLVSRLQDPGVMIFIHIDKKSQSLFQTLATDTRFTLIQDRVDVKWAHITQVKAVFSSYKEICKLGFSFDHLVVISGQDYPIQPVSRLVQVLSVQKNKSFISSVPLSKDGWAGAMKRYRYHYYVRMEKLWRGLMMLTGIRRQFPFGLNPFGGSQWVNLAKPHMDHVINFCDTHVSLMNFMETVRFPEEMIFQTLLMNSVYSKDCVNEDLRFIKWLPGKSNPEVLTEEYKTELKQATGKFFARKFDYELSASLIRSLDESIA